MAAKGQIAKDKVLEKIAQSFGSDWIGVFDKKAYVWAEENGEKVQIAISLTCPKVAVGTIPKNLDFENASSAEAAPSSFQPAEISDEEKNNIIKLIEKLGL